MTNNGTEKGIRTDGHRNAKPKSHQNRNESIRQIALLYQLTNSVSAWIAAMRELSETQKRGLRRRLAALIDHGRDRERVSHQQSISWQENRVPGESRTLQKLKPGQPLCDTVLFFNRRIVMERKRRLKPAHVSQVVNQLFQDANLTDAMASSPARIRTEKVS